MVNQGDFLVIHQSVRLIALSFGFLATSALVSAAQNGPEIRVSCTLSGVLEIQFVSVADVTSSACKAIVKQLNEASQTTGWRLVADDLNAHVRIDITQPRHQASRRATVEFSDDWSESDPVGLGRLSVALRNAADDIAWHGHTWIPGEEAAAVVLADEFMVGLKERVDGSSKFKQIQTHLKNWPIACGGRIIPGDGSEGWAISEQLPWGKFSALRRSYLAVEPSQGEATECEVGLSRKEARMVWLTGYSHREYIENSTSVLALHIPVYGVAEQEIARVFLQHFCLPDGVSYRDCVKSGELVVYAGSLPEGSEEKGTALLSAMEIDNSNLQAAAEFRKWARGSAESITVMSLSPIAVQHMMNAGDHLGTRDVIGTLFHIAINAPSEENMDRLGASLGYYLAEAELRPDEYVYLFADKVDTLLSVAPPSEGRSLTAWMDSVYRNPGFESQSTQVAQQWWSLASAVARASAFGYLDAKEPSVAIDRLAAAWELTGSIDIGTELLEIVGLDPERLDPQGDLTAKVINELHVAGKIAALDVLSVSRAGDTFASEIFSTLGDLDRAEWAISRAIETDSIVLNMVGEGQRSPFLHNRLGTIRYELDDVRGALSAWDNGYGVTGVMADNVASGVRAFQDGAFGSLQIVDSGARKLVADVRKGQSARIPEQVIRMYMPAYTVFMDSVGGWSALRDPDYKESQTGVITNVGGLVHGGFDAAMLSWLFEGGAMNYDPNNPGIVRTDAQSDGYLNYYFETGERSEISRRLYPGVLSFSGIPSVASDVELRRLLEYYDQALWKQVPLSDVANFAPELGVFLRH